MICNVRLHFCGSILTNITNIKCGLNLLDIEVYDIFNNPNINPNPNNNPHTNPNPYPCPYHPYPTLILILTQPLDYTVYIVQLI